jgi:pyrimidine operon attenuation protein/uracil phosphoribosyltransferase
MGHAVEKEKARVMDEKALQRAIARISYEIIERNRGVQDLCLVGVKTRGVHIARRIAEKIAQVEGAAVPLGILDITPYRDDLESKKGVEDTSSIDFSLTDMRIVLVDDVIHTGRTVRAAIDALMARGRPRNIQLAALVDRGHRELPIRADFIGKNLPTSSEETVRVHIMPCDGEEYVAIYTKG